MEVTAQLVATERKYPTIASSTGPFKTTGVGNYEYTGNRLYPPSRLINSNNYLDSLHTRCERLADDPRWGHLSRINGVIFSAASEYFERLAAQFVPLPLTTRMISSPGALYGKGRIDYTTDTAPVTLKWFDEEREVFLSESSQIYLELALLQPAVDQVYSIYNSFRKERSDDTHLSEFHHIEYEGHVSAERNVQIAEGLVRHLIQSMFARCEQSLRYYLLPHQLRRLETMAIAPYMFQRVSLSDCFELLFKDTRDARYREFTLEDRFGRWEEIRLTELLGGSLAISGYPLYEVPFYHTADPSAAKPTAVNTDLIWDGYAETIGAGLRIGCRDELEEKARAFNLPREDYAPYLRARNNPEYRRSAGFGLGWERFVQGVLRLPSISEACVFPRTHRGVFP